MRVCQVVSRRHLLVESYCIIIIGFAISSLVLLLPLRSGPRSLVDGTVTRTTIHGHETELLVNDSDIPQAFQSTPAPRTLSPIRKICSLISHPTLTMEYGLECQVLQHPTTCAKYFDPLG